MDILKCADLKIISTHAHVRAVSQAFVSTIENVQFQLAPRTSGIQKRNGEFFLYGISTRARIRAVSAEMEKHLILRRISTRARVWAVSHRQMHRNHDGTYFNPRPRTGGILSGNQPPQNRMKFQPTPIRAVSQRNNKK